MAGLGIDEKEELRLLRIANDLELKLRELPPDSEEWAALKLEVEEASQKWREYHERRISSVFSNTREPLLCRPESPDESYMPTAKQGPPKVSTARIIAASIVGILVFLSIIILLGTLLSVIVSLLMQIKIVEIVIRFFVTLPISHGWFISEGTALFAVLGVPVYITAYGATYSIVEKIGKQNYLPFLIIGIMLLIIYIPSGILDIASKQAFWADIYGTIAAIYFIKESLELHKKQ